MAARHETKIKTTNLNIYENNTKSNGVGATKFLTHH